MIKQEQEISVRGKKVRVPAVRIDDRTVIVTGRFPRIASIYDAAFTEGELVSDPASFIQQLKASGLKADLFTFAQTSAEPQPKHPYPFEWDNAAVAPTADYQAWWERLPQVARKNVRRAGKRGLTVEVVPFDDTLVRGIKDIYDETPVRQGRRFWHYGKDLETVKADNVSYLERAVFIGAYHEGELIGFMKIVYVNTIAIVMQILAKAAHNDKRPMNALIAKAVEVCHQQGMTQLVYSKFTYGKKTDSDIAEFKRRNGFAQVDYPKYFVPVSLRGRVAFALKLHRGVLELLPSGMINSLLSIRSRLLESVRQRPSFGAVAVNAPASVPDGREI